jgi:hypothetical protein
VVLEEHARDELAARTHLDLSEDRLEVVLHRPRRDVQPVGDRARPEPLRDELRHRALALGQAVGVGDQRHELVRPGGLDDHGRLGVGVVAERRAAHEQPALGRRADSRASDGARRRLPMRDAARSGRHRGHHGRQRFVRTVAAQLGEPHLGGGVRHRDRVVGREQREADGLLGVLAFLGHRGGEQHRAAQSLGQVARHRRDERRVVRREVAPVGGAQQRQAAPRRPVAGQRGSQLVAEAVGALELAVALAAVEVSVRRFAEGRRARFRAGQCAEGVEVLPASLDLGHAAIRRRRQPVLDDLAGRQERGRVHRDDADAIERHRARQDPGGAEGEVAHARAAVQEPDEIVAQVLG